MSNSLKWRGRKVRAINHADRAALCAHFGVPNTGRQWRKLRKRDGWAIHKRVKP